MALRTLSQAPTRRTLLAGAAVAPIAASTTSANAVRLDPVAETATQLTPVARAFAELQELKAVLETGPLGEWAVTVPPWPEELEKQARDALEKITIAEQYILGIPCRSVGDFDIKLGIILIAEHPDEVGHLTFDDSQLRDFWIELRAFESASSAVER